MAKDRRLTGKQIQRLLSNPKPIPLGIRKPEEGPSRRNLVLQGAAKNYDALNAENTLKDFASFLRNVISRYEENQRLMGEAEARESDLNHCMELTVDLTDKERRMIFRRLTEALQTRRTCKTENEILAPIYSYISDKALINKLAQIQGAVSSVKDTVSSRSYGCRTSVLDDFRQESPETNQAAT